MFDYDALEAEEVQRTYVHASSQTERFAPSQSLAAPRTIAIDARGPRQAMSGRKDTSGKASTLNRNRAPQVAKGQRSLTSSKPLQKQSGERSVLEAADKLCRQTYLNGRVHDVVHRLCASPSPAETQEIKSEIAKLAHLDVADFGEEAVRKRNSLDAMHASWQQWERIFQQIRVAKLFGGKMPDLDFDRLADTMNPAYGYDTPREAFRPLRYKTFDEWFLRELAPHTLAKSRAKAASAHVCCPCQSTVAARVLSGAITLKVSVVAVEALLKLVQGDRLVQFGLRKTDYHRVHSPVDGSVSNVVVHEKDQLFPGSEAMTIISILAKFGSVRVMCIGEWAVQSFVATGAKVGSDVRKMDELGFFYFGSQVILVVPGNVRLLLYGGERVFPGDPLASLVSRGKSIP